MNFIYNFIPQEIIKAIGWTIFHSLWQGALISVLLGGVLLISGKKSAQLRYNFSVTALIIMFALSAATFIEVYDASGTDTSSNLEIISAINVLSLNAAENNSAIQAASNNGIIQILEKTFSPYLPQIVSVWFLGFIIFSMRFIGGVLYVQGLRSKGIILLNDLWYYRMTELSNRVGIKKNVQISESSKVKVPIALGYLKPMILLPVGMLSGLPQDQVEAIILHELAHIKRYDFMLNLIQTIIETLFFYHPAVWWISSVIKNERENCCDDLTLKLCGGSLVYFKALYNLQQIYSEENNFVLAAIGKRNQLFRRINRMNTNNKNTSYGAKFAAFAAVLIIFAAISFYSTSSAKEAPGYISTAAFVNPFSSNDESISLNNPADENLFTPDTTSIKKGKRTLKFDDSDKRYKAKLNDSKLEELYIDGDKVDDKNLSKYESVVAEHVKEYDSAMKDFKKNMKNFKENMKSFEEKMKHYKGNHDFAFDFDTPFHLDMDSAKWISPAPLFPPNIDSAEYNQMRRNIEKNVHKSIAGKSFHVPPIHIPPIHIPRIDFDSTMNCESFDSDKFRASMKEWKKEFGKEMEKFKVEMKAHEGDFAKLQKEIKENVVNNVEFKKSMEELKINMGKLKTDMKILKEYLHDVKEELIKDKLIDEDGDMENFVLTKDEMKVDGKKVSAELHKKYLEIYKKHYGKDLTDDQKIHF